MASTYRTVTTEHLGCDATETDLAQFVSLCEAVHQEVYTDLDAETVTEYVWGDGDYHRSARRILGECRYRQIVGE